MAVSINRNQLDILEQSPKLLRDLILYVILKRNKGEIIINAEEIEEELLLWLESGRSPQFMIRSSMADDTLRCISVTEYKPVLAVCYDDGSKNSFCGTSTMRRTVTTNRQHVTCQCCLELLYSAQDK